jgi:hypothetical protein
MENHWSTENRSMKAFYLYSHQNKAKVLVNALRESHYIPTARVSIAQFALTDTDHKSRWPSLKNFQRVGKKIFLYPHAARPNVFNDFDGYPIYPHITAGFVAACGHVEVIRRICINYPLEVIGWYLCPMKPFQPRENYRKVLFAPIHPNNNGTLSSIDRKVNIDTFKILLALVEAGEIELTVRYLRKMDTGGIWEVPNVKYIQGQPDQSYKEIDEADLVVSHQTAAWIAIARGVPTVMMGENIPPRVGCEELGDFHIAKSFEKYRELLMYPYDILTEKEPLSLFRRAIASDTEIADWKRRMVGEPFEPKVFIRTVEKYL